MTAYVQQHNDHKVRKQRNKPGPNGVSYNIAFNRPEAHGGRNCKIEVDQAYIQHLLQDHPGQDAMKFFPDWFADIAAEAHIQAGRPKLSFETAWDAWRAMIVYVTSAVVERASTQE